MNLTYVVAKLVKVYDIGFTENVTNKSESELKNGSIIEIKFGGYLCVCESFL